MNGQQFNSEISDKEITEFLNWKLQYDKPYFEESHTSRKKLYFLKNKWDTLNIFWKLKIDKSQSASREYLFTPQNKWLDTIFSEADKVFMFQQLNSQKDSTWHQSYDNCIIKYKIKGKRPKCYFLSTPLFSVDRRYLLIKETFYCGRLCAYWGFKIFKRTGKNDWEYVATANFMMS